MGGTIGSVVVDRLQGFDAEFVRLSEAGLVEGPVLDLGCGTGELARYLARRGHRVLGIDLSTLAIERARAKARWRRVDAQFLVWDAAAGFAFRTVVDSGMYKRYKATASGLDREGEAANFPAFYLLTGPFKR